MKVAVMQPTYLPWIGYFDLMEQSDVFVLLDGAQFAKQSWQQRNRIRTEQGLQWLTVPVLTKGRFGQLISEVEINPNAKYPRKHLKSIENFYSRSGYFDSYFTELHDLLTEGVQGGALAELNISIIHWIAGHLGIETEVVRSSSLPVEGDRSELLVGICEYFGAAEYVSPPGSREYLEDDRIIFERSAIEVLVHEYTHPVYRQLYEPFIPYASAIDLLFNEGPEAASIIRSGRREPVSL